MKTCENCGERVYKLGCVNCNEAAYIADQVELDEWDEYEEAGPMDLEDQLDRLLAKS